MAGTEIRVTGLDENSFRTLHISILQKTNRAELTIGAAIHPHAYAWGIPRLFVKTVFDVAKLKEAVSSALQQIRDKAYATQLTARGIDKNRIRAYGIAFAGKRVLVGTASVPATAS